MTDATADWSFARTPKWIVAHVLAVTLVVVCVLAGMWQWSRHQEVSGRNDRIEARRDLPPIDRADLATGPPADIEFRMAEVTGIWDGSGQVAVRNRSLNGVPGCHVVTPLQLETTGAVLVTRGFVPLPDCDDTGVVGHPPPAGAHTVTGLVRTTQTRSGFGVADPDEGVLRTLNRVDVERIDEQYPPELVDVYVELATVEPAPADPTEAPTPIPPPELDDGPHLGYTGQWFLFALVGVVGYPIVLRRQSRSGVRRPKPAGPPPRRPSAGPADRAPPASSRN